MSENYAARALKAGRRWQAYQEMVREGAQDVLKVPLEPAPTETEEAQDHGTIELRSYPTCPQCGAPWDNDHIDGGHCPGRPSECSCQCDMQYHRLPTGLHRQRRTDRFCPCRFLHVRKE